MPDPACILATDWVKIKKNGCGRKSLTTLALA